MDQDQRRLTFRISAETRPKAIICNAVSAATVSSCILHMVPNPIGRHVLPKEAFGWNAIDVQGCLECAETVGMGGRKSNHNEYFTNEVIEKNG